MNHPQDRKPAMSPDEGPPGRTAPAPDEAPSPGHRSGVVQAITITLLVLGIATAVFVIQNTQPVRIEWAAWNVKLPLAGALLMAAAAGGAMGFLVAFIRQMQYRRVARREHKRHVGSQAPD